MRQAVVVAAVRTAIGSFGGTLKGTPAVDLGASVIAQALEQVGVAADTIDEVIMGMIYQAGLGPNPARQAAVDAGLPYAVPAMTVNKLCGSGLKSVGLAAAAVRLGEAQRVVAGGMESMSRAPYTVPSNRWGSRLGHGEIADLMILDGLWDCFYDCHMGMTAENLSQEYSISRAAQDDFALRSQRNYEAAQGEGRFASQIVPLEIAQRRADPLIFQIDEHPRVDATDESLGRLSPAFKEDGTVTAGNASGINDGAAALLIMSADEAQAEGLTPMARIVDTVSVGVDPRIMGIGPAPAITKLLERNQLNLEQVDLLEVNEAFAAQSLAVGKALDWDLSKVNVNGGAIAMGHPVGASGARIAVTLLHEMQRRASRRGIAALCIGGGMGIATLFEAV
jgi:acetyl-CoA C-acetyltransferase